MNRAYYSSSIEIFCVLEPDQILGQMTREHSFDLNGLQRDAWIEQTKLLKNALVGLSGRIYFEFSIPRMGRRIDAVVIAGSAVFIIEFKVGANNYESSDIDQVMDYALDMRNFHEGSHTVSLAPVLVATNAPFRDVVLCFPNDGLFAPICCNSNTLHEVIETILSFQSGRLIDYDAWENSGYKPTPTIIEATLALYNGHSVSEISRSDASAKNLSLTSMSVAEIIERTKNNSEKSIVFLTGVPGAGKTLVGLDIATKHINKDDELYSVFLSGNGPLVKILQEALARDLVSRTSEEGSKVRKGDALREVKTFIQNVHEFRDECLRDFNKPPIEHVALFDEAQRAWTKEQTIKFMREKKHQPDFNQSEPEYLISCMNRHHDWATIVCLVGGGQEINTGEAGIVEWFNAVRRSFPNWRIYLSDQLTDSEYGAGEVLKESSDLSGVKFQHELHLNTSVRSFRSENVSLFVKQLLDMECEPARNNLLTIRDNYPIVVTRNFETAKNWLREHARGSERYGMVVSSQAERLKPYAIDVRVKTNPVHWFLNDKSDVRSSYYLEDVATEFDVQGLELDWVCMAWDADFRYREEGWDHWSFRGSRWQRINKLERRNYQKNAYRVLLTRARQGMVLVVPEGSPDDRTRRSEYYDPIFNYLLKIGIPCI
jgi:hypothetical protein